MKGLWPPNKQLIPPQQFSSVFLEKLLSQVGNSILLMAVWGLVSVWMFEDETEKENSTYGSFCSSATLQLKSRRVGESCWLSQCYSVNIGYYSLLRYLGSLPRSKEGMSLLLAGHQWLSCRCRLCANFSAVKIEFVSVIPQTDPHIPFSLSNLYIFLNYMHFYNTKN